MLLLYLETKDYSLLCWDIHNSLEIKLGSTFDLLAFLLKSKKNSPQR